LDASQLLAGLGQALRERRKEAGLSQEELQLQTGVHRNYIGGIERGERQPTVAVIAVLAEALGASASELVAAGERRAGK
jgi:transcriptional regulator with XRE-family HTH domain